MKRGKKGNKEEEKKKRGEKERNKNKGSINF